MKVKISCLVIFLFLLLFNTVALAEVDYKQIDYLIEYQGAYQKAYQLLKKADKNKVKKEYLGELYILTKTDIKQGLKILTELANSIEETEKIIDYKLLMMQGKTELLNQQESKEAKLSLLKEIEKLVEETLKLDSNNVDALIAKANVKRFKPSLFRKKNLKEAIKLLKKAIAIDDDKIKAYYDLADIYIYEPQVKDYDQALNYLNQAEEKFKQQYKNEEVNYSNKVNYSFILINLAKIYYERGKIDISQSYTSKHLELAPNSVWGYLYRGLNYEAQGEVDKSLQSLKEGQSHAEMANKERANMILEEQVNRIEKKYK